MSQKPTQPPAPDASWAPYPTRDALGEDEIKITSCYLTMRDGVKIAVSVFLPINLPAGERRPTILYITRYWRAMEMVPPNLNIRRYLANGYAWVSMDVRGTGASFGCWSGAWSPEEVQDYDEVVTWIAIQAWCDGKVGTRGISYMGTAAEMLVTRCNPAVKAAIPQFSMFDPLLELNAGGLLLEKFLQAYADHSRKKDRNELQTVPLGKNKNLQVGVLPVDEDTDRFLLEAAIAEHMYNFDTYFGSLPLRFRDDPWESDPSLSLKDFAPYGKIEELQRASIPMYSYSGYGDAAFVLAAVHRFLNIRNPGSKLVLGPWEHGGLWHISPYVQQSSAFDHIAEEIRFFDYHMKGIDTGILDEAPVHYYTMAEEQWHAADAFPPPNQPLDLYLSVGNCLHTSPPDDASASDSYGVDYSTGSGTTARWDTLLVNDMLHYPERAQVDLKLLCYTSAPLDEDVTITGMPLVTLYLSASASDADVFAYLEEVLPDGSVQYITEGQLKALHRKLSDETPPYIHAVPYHSFLRKDAMPLIPGEIAELVFHLLPVSYLIRRGHCIRLALGGADADHFKIPNAPPPVVSYYRQADYPSHIRLPVEG